MSETNSPNNDSKEKEDGTITIKIAEYDQITTELQTCRSLLKETLLRLDRMAHSQKQQLSQSLNATVRSHNLIADIEGIKDSITSQARF